MYKNCAFPLADPPQAGQYRVLVVDPPWNQRKTGKRKVRPNQGTQLDYPTMTKDALVDLPIRRWADKQAFLWLWATNSKDQKTGEPILKMAFDLMEAWGFVFYTMLNPPTAKAGGFGIQVLMSFWLSPQPLAIGVHHPESSSSLIPLREQAALSQARRPKLAGSDLPLAA